MSVLLYNGTYKEVSISELLQHYDYTHNLIGISIATVFSIIFTLIGLFFSLKVNKKTYSFYDDQFKHHSTKWLLGLVIFGLTLLNDSLSLMEAFFFWTGVDATFNSVRFNLITFCTK